MNLKTYRARSMADALAEVKRDLGKHAVILHTRAYRVGAVMGMGGHEEFEITATDQLPAQARQARAAARERSLVAAELPASAPSAFTPDTRESAPFTPSSFTSLVTSDASPDPDLERPAPAAERPPQVAAPTPQASTPPPAPPAANPAPPTPHTFTNPLPGVEVKYPPRPQAPAGAQRIVASRVDLAPQSEQTVAQLREEIGAIRRLMGQVLAETRRAGEARSASLLDRLGLPEPLLELALALREQGVREDIIDRVVGPVRDELTPDELRDGPIVRAAVLRRLGALMPVAGAAARPAPARTQHPAPALAQSHVTLALIGPTGVGKTTTIAKLAATYKLRYNLPVALITCDTYRIAAVEQLRTYAQIIGVPLKVALTPRDVEQARAQALAEGASAIFVDTAGRAPSDTARLEETAAFVQASSPTQTHLVVSAASSSEVLESTLHRFMDLSPSHLILTKLDEALRFGGLPALTASVPSLRVSYLTTGQEVPDDIELATSERLARLVLDGKLLA